MREKEGGERIRLLYKHISRVRVRESEIESEIESERECVR